MAKTIEHSPPWSKTCHEKSADVIVPEQLWMYREGRNSRRCHFQMETGHGTEYRQLHIKDYLREIPAEQGRVTGVYAHEWITRNTGTDTDFWTDNLLVHRKLNI